MGRRNKKSGSKTPSPCVSANASPALPPAPPTIEPPPLTIDAQPLQPIVEEQKTLPSSPVSKEPTDLSGGTVAVEEPGLVRRILNWIPYFRS